jgi:hypothetical protein
VQWVTDGSEVTMMRWMKLIWGELTSRPRVAACEEEQCRDDWIPE